MARPWTWDDLGHVVKDFLEGIYFVGVHCSLEIVVIIRVLLSLGNVSIAKFFFSCVIYFDWEKGKVEDESLTATSTSALKESY